MPVRKEFEKILNKPVDEAERNAKVFAPQRKTEGPAASSTRFENESLKIVKKLVDDARRCAKVLAPPTENGESGGRFETIRKRKFKDCLKIG